jgi:hypothetical protein
MKRSFEIVDYPHKGSNTGNYSGSSPGRAANKIFNKLVNDMNFKNANNKKILVFSIKEKKKDAKEKKYVGTRIHLVTPTVITFKSGNQITFNYKALVTSYKKYYENEN